MRIYLNQKAGEESRRQEIQDRTEGRTFRQSPGLSDTDTLMVRGVAAMPSRIARVVYVGREKDALEQFSTGELALCLLFIKEGYSN